MCLRRYHPSARRVVQPAAPLRNEDRNPSGKKIADQRDDLVGLVLQREMAGVEEVELGVAKVALVRVRTVGGEDRVVLAPDDQRRRPVLAEIGLNGGIEGHVGAVVVEEVELD